jgi:hypothetical protein
MRPTLLIALLALAVPSLAFADEASDARKAKDLFAAGQKLYKADKYAEAVLKFEAAYAAKPHPVIYFNIARCYEQLGDASKAVKAYRDYLRLSPEAKDREAVNESIAILDRKVKEKAVTHVTVVVDPAAARVEIDGTPVGGTPALADLAAGVHKVVVTYDGYEKLERTVTTAPGQSVELNLALRRLAGAPPPPPPLLSSDAPKRDDGLAAGSLTPMPGAGSGATNVTASADAPRKRVATWVVGGVAVAGLGAGVALGVLSMTGSNALRASDPGSSAADRNAQVQGITTMAIGADVAYGVAAAAAITAVVLFFVEK